MLTQKELSPFDRFPYRSSTLDHFSPSFLAKKVNFRCIFHFDLVNYTKINVILFQDDYKRVIVCIEDAILATDLAVYFRRRQDTFNLIESNAVDFFNDHHR